LLDWVENQILCDRRIARGNVPSIDLGELLVFPDLQPLHSAREPKEWLTGCAHQDVVRDFAAFCSGQEGVGTIRTRYRNTRNLIMNRVSTSWYPLAAGLAAFGCSSARRPEPRADFAYAYSQQAVNNLALSTTSGGTVALAPSRRRPTPE